MVKNPNPPRQPAGGGKDKKETAKNNFFGKEGYLKRIELREKLRGASPKIPGSAKWYTRKQRVNIEKEIFGKKYGNYITPQEYHQSLRELEQKKYKAKKSEEKTDIDRKIKYLKKLSGF